MSITITPSVAVTDVASRLFVTRQLRDAIKDIPGFVTVKNLGGGGAGPAAQKTVFIGRAGVTPTSGFPVAVNDQVTVPATFEPTEVFAICNAGRDSNVALLVVE